jgi:hypothetical protein
VAVLTRNTGTLARSMGIVACVVAMAVTAVAAGRAAAATGARPTTAEIRAETRAAVLASKARLVSLRIVPPKAVYSLTVKVDDPAVYLGHRMNRVADFIMSRVAYRRTSFTVLDHTGARAFWVRFVSTPKSGGYTWYVRPGLTACIDNNAFGIESNPDGTAPACPAH